MRAVRPQRGGAQMHRPETRWLQFFCHPQNHLWIEDTISQQVLLSFAKKTRGENRASHTELHTVRASFISICGLSLSHPAEWRSDGRSLQPAGSCSLRETDTTPHQTCECGLAQTDCTSLSYLWHMLETNRPQITRTADSKSRSNGHMQCNISLENILEGVVLGRRSKIYSCYPHLSDARGPKLLANTSSSTPVIWMNTHYIIISITCTGIITL